ncbi:MAG: hypothetical protein ACRC5M_07355 [Anaeroplasmataceae bacterium]
MEVGSIVELEFSTCDTLHECIVEKEYVFEHGRRIEFYRVVCIKNGTGIGAGDYTLEDLEKELISRYDNKRLNKLIVKTNGVVKVILERM